MMSKELLGVDDIMSLFSISESTVRRWIGSGKLSGQKAGGQWRFDRSLVMRAFEQGLLSGASDPASHRTPPASHARPPWATRLLANWQRRLQHYLNELQPDHIVVNDRRGAKVWQLMMPDIFVWGENVWHSTAIDVMEKTELHRIFGKRKVLLFDEMMKHGRAMHELRRTLESVKATVKSFVCICSRSHLESGETLESTALMCEKLDNKEFGRRATMISRLVGLSEPPLDADHLTVHGKMADHHSADSVVRRLANWGRAFVVTHPNPDQNGTSISLKFR